MTTVIRPEISEKNKYWISKHRHYERELHRVIFQEILPLGVSLRDYIIRKELI